MIITVNFGIFSNLSSCLAHSFSAKSLVILDSHRLYFIPMSTQSETRFFVRYIRKCSTFYVLITVSLHSLAKRSTLSFLLEMQGFLSMWVTWRIWVLSKVYWLFWYIWTLWLLSTQDLQTNSLWPVMIRVDMFLLYADSLIWSTVDKAWIIFAACD